MRRKRPVISAFDFDVIKNALKAIIAQGDIPECEWDKQARNLAKTFSGTKADETMIRVLLETCRTCATNASEEERLATLARGAHVEGRQRNIQRLRELVARSRHPLCKGEAERTGSDGPKREILPD
ncbi:hypothetical protein FJ492_24035 [Mesorhizobium sp. B2-5-4]|uniref:hypothetical protein n=1 Tax=unclassified Mesorhizobium TaxID=325217 RepID=UPI00112CE99B|nr:MULTISPECIES: hypothetical protein [unclassified Mesorhizobium]TPJ83292.1 hypothetical protein FJ434_20010 [Mesorhizobium sp. B2-5-13]TPK38293.1 hypothetical protein FJ492_24035 [Mesorhizobium sp. B2-5-4]TPK44460.1 hypothetical protein FJ560_23060 [Mesorhizobium sp. B2-5-5]